MNCKFCPTPIALLDMCRRCYYREYEKRPRRYAWKKAYSISEPRREYARQHSKTEAFKISNHRFSRTQKFKDNLRRYQMTLNGKFKHGIREAKRRNLVWNISFDAYKELVSPDKCHYCEETLSKMGINLDRKDNDDGYTMLNVVPCCGDCNRTKGDRLTYAEMVAVSSLLRSMRSKDAESTDTGSLGTERAA